MKGVVGSKDLVFSTGMLTAVASRQLDRRLVGFSAAIAKKNAVGKGVATQLPGELRLRLNVVEIGHVQ